MTPEEEIEVARDAYNRIIARARMEIAHRDRKAIAMYDASIKGVHNLHCRGWRELSPVQRDEWRQKAGIDFREGI